MTKEEDKNILTTVHNITNDDGKECNPFQQHIIVFIGHYYRKKTYSQRLSIEERRRYSRKIPRCALRRYHDSPFRFLFDRGNDQALINITGLDQRVFRQLLLLFRPAYDKYTIDPATMIVR